MPTNRTRRTRKMNPGVSDNLRSYLLSGESEKGDAEVFLLSGSPAGLRAEWNAVKDETMTDWIQKNPCRRPWAWWEFEAKRQDTGSRAFFDPLPVPRQRIGGKGQTTSEKYPAVKPDFIKGFPSSWVWVEDEDPPRFESEAAFLDRHGLLTESEKKWLSRHPEALESEKLKLLEIGND